nr:transposase [Actinoplanes sp. ATCC 53533]
MRVVLSVAAGKISSVTLLRRLSTYSRRNKHLQGVPGVRPGYPHDPTAAGASTDI